MFWGTDGSQLPVGVRILPSGNFGCEFWSYARGTTSGVNRPGELTSGTSDLVERSSEVSSLAGPGRQRLWRKREIDDVELAPDASEKGRALQIKSA